jgi:Zn-dependent metalloprotease
VCLKPFDVFISDKLQSRLEGVLVTLCTYEGWSENKFTLCNFNTSLTVYLSSSAANKAHRFGDHKYDYLSSLTYCISGLSAIFTVTILLL